MKRLLPLPVLVGAVLLLSCQDSPSPTTPDGDVQAARGGGPGGAAGCPSGPGASSPEADDIRDLIDDLLDGGLERAALSQFCNVERQLEAGETDDAVQKTFDLVDFLLEKHEQGQLQDPDGSGPETASSGAGELTSLLLQFVGVGDLDAQALDDILTGEVDGAIAVVGPEGGTVVTEAEFAGVRVPDAAIGSDDGTDESVLITIRRLDPDQQPGGRCLPTGLPQLEGCYEYERFPDGDFAADVTVGICIDDSDPDWQDYLLHKFDPTDPGAGVVQLPEATAGFLDCAGFTPLAAGGDGALWNLARRGWDAVRDAGAGFLASPLRAADTGAGGLTLSFSDIGWAEAAEMTIASGDGQTGQLGETLPNPLVLSVRGTHHDTTGPVDGALVTFDVDGDASLSGLSEADPGASPALNLLQGDEGTTDPIGALSVPVTLGQNASDTVVVKAFLAGAAGSPLTYRIPVDPLVLDQENDPATNTSFGCGTTGLSLYQSFTPAASPLVAVELRLRAGGSFPSNGTTTDIHVRDGGPSGPILSSASASVSGPLSAGDEVLVRHVLPQDLTVSSTDTLVVEWVSPGGQSTNSDAILTWMGRQDDPYPEGHMFGCTGNTRLNDDVNFRTFTR